MVAFIKKYQSALKIGLLLLVLFFVGQFVYHTDLNVILEYLQKMPFTFVGILVLSFFAYFCATISWKLCMGAESNKVGVGYLFVVRHVGEMLSVFNPTSVIAGEALKVHYLKSKDVSQSTRVSSILLSRVLIILSALFLMLLSVLYLIIGNRSGENDIILIVVGLIVTVVFGYFLTRVLLHSKMYLYKTVVRLQSRFGTNFFSNKLLASVLEINEASHLFYKQYKGRFFVGFLLSLIHWVLGAAEFYLVLRVLGLEVSVVDAVAIEMGVILFKTIGAIVPGQVGVEEYANKIMLGAVGVASNEVWLVVSIMRRARQLFWVAVASVFYWFLRKEGSVDGSESVV